MLHARLPPSKNNPPARLPAVPRQGPKRVRHLTLIPALAFMIAAHADEAPRDNNQQTPFGLGMGAAGSQKPYAGIDPDGIAFPLIIYRGEWLDINGIALNLKLPSAGPVTFALNVTYAMDGYNASDAPVFAGMAARKDGIWAGPTAAWSNPVANLSVGWLGDTFANSEGQKLWMHAEHTFPLGRFMFTPHVGATWYDDNYVNYYYGVRADEATPTRAFYRPKAAVAPSAGLRTTFVMTKQDSLTLDVSSEFQPSEIKDSPLVDKATRNVLFLGYVHMF